MCVCVQQTEGERERVALTSEPGSQHVCWSEATHAKTHVHVANEILIGFLVATLPKLVPVIAISTDKWPCLVKRRQQKRKKKSERRGRNGLFWLIRHANGSF